MHFVKVATLLLTLYRCMFVGGPNPIFHSKTVLESAKCKVLYFKTILEVLLTILTRKRD